MIGKSHAESLSKSKPTEVWVLDSLGERLIKYDRLNLCSQIKAIPIEDVIAMLEKMQIEIDEKATEICDDGWWLVYNDIIQSKIESLKGKRE